MMHATITAQLTAQIELRQTYGMFESPPAACIIDYMTQCDRSSERTLQDTLELVLSEIKSIHDIGVACEARYQAARSKQKGAAECSPDPMNYYLINAAFLTLQVSDHASDVHSALPKLLMEQVKEPFWDNWQRQYGDVLYDGDTEVVMVSATTLLTHQILLQHAEDRMPAFLIADVVVGMSMCALASCRD